MHPFHCSRYSLLPNRNTAEATFANPALLAGDQSLIDVIAHELAHSWSGNLTTNRDWYVASVYGVCMGLHAVGALSG